MKANHYLLMYLFCLVGGILLLIFSNHEGLFSTIVIIIGVLFLIASVVSLIMSFIPSRHKKENQNAEEKAIVKTSQIIPALGGLIFGILLVSMPGFFAGYIIYTFAIMLILLGLSQLMTLAADWRTTGTSGWFLMVPLLTLVFGIVAIALGADKIDHIMSIITGIILICFAINGTIGYLRRETKLRQHQLLTGSPQIDNNN